MINQILTRLRETLAGHADENNEGYSTRFFKEEIRFYGVKVPVVHRIAREYYREIQKWPKNEIFQACEQLWRSGMLEESFVACDWSHESRKDYLPEDFPLFERWVGNYVNNWATCDTLCNHTVGDFLMMYPEFVGRLEQWARSENRWMRRAAAVSLIIPARKGLFLNHIYRIADILLRDTDDLVQKGYGWMLKAASEVYPQEVFQYVVSKKAGMPRTAYRYAIEKLSPELRAEAMRRD